MLKFSVSGVSALMLLAAAQSAFADTARVYARPGATAAQIAAAAETCKAPVKDISDYELLGPPAGDHSLEGAAGAAIASMLVGAVRTASARERAMVICMRKSGFAYVPLTADEDAAYARSTEDATRDAWTDAFLATVTEARVKDALQPVHPPLPAATPGPYLAGALRLLPETLKLAEGPVRFGTPLLTAQGVRRATAKVKASAEVGALTQMFGFTNGTATTGAVFHQVNYFGPPSLAEEDKTMWCGPVDTPRGGKLVCVTSRFAGQRMDVAMGSPMLASPDPEYARTGHNVKTPLELELLPAESAPRFDVELNPDRIGKKYISITAIAKDDKKTSHLWAGTLDFDAAGRAVLPFWDRTLVITRAEKGVTVAFEPRSDGLGWYDELPKPTAVDKAD